MTRKDFEMIAKVVGNTLATVTEESRQCLALDFAYALKETNPRFDTSRFVMSEGNQQQRGHNRRNSIISE